MDARHIEMLKALAEPSRLRIFWLLAQIDERISVSEAMDVVGQSHYNASRNLKILQKAGLVTPQKDGKWVFYTIQKEDAPFFSALLATVRAIPAEEFAEEIKRCRWRLEMLTEGHCVIGQNSKEWQATPTTA